jgi:uncharacterized protein
MGENNIEIRKSSISGKGVFANSLIKKGERICFMEGELMSLDQMIRKVDDGKEEPSDPLGVDDEIYMDLNELPRSINHSCNPNAFVRGNKLLELVAIRDIQPDEEIAYDYSTTMNDNKEKIEESGNCLWTIKCKCRSKNCRGIIDQFKTLPLKRQKFYVKNKFAPDFILKKFA